MIKPPIASFPSKKCGSLMPLLFVSLLLCIGQTSAQQLSTLIRQPLQVAGQSWRVEPFAPTTFLFIGSGFTAGMPIVFTYSPTTCAGERHSPAVFEAAGFSATEATAVVTIDQTAAGPHYVCINDVHQGTEDQNVIIVLATETSEDLFPLWVQIIFILLLLCLSGLFSGLNLGLMSLDSTELQIVSEVGDKEEAKYAKAIMPMRKRGNLLLCTLLLGNVLVNNTLTILLDGIFSGLVAILGATAAIVVFGEIVPQSICSRHGLFVGAKTMFITKFFMLVTLPASYPISKVLDKILGQEIGAVYQRKQLLRLVQLTRQHTDLRDHEINILTGALTFKDKTAEQIMTPMSEVFMIDINSVLDYKTMSNIFNSGHSRIPVYKGSKDQLTGILYMKDLTFIDPDDKTPLETVIKYYNHPIEEVYYDTTLDSLLDVFKTGKCHMSFVIKIDNERDGDPLREIVGVVTLEDVLEEIIQTEIYDETDKARMPDGSINPVSNKLNLPAFMHDDAHAQSATRLSDQMSLAIITFLSTTVPAFDRKLISERVLRQLVTSPLSIKDMDKEEGPQDVIYTTGKSTNVFTLVVSGNLKVKIGKEGFSFDSGPFSTLALSALSTDHFEPDFTASIHSEHVVLLQISRAQYKEAIAATKREIGLSHHDSSSQNNHNRKGGDGDNSGGSAVLALPPNTENSSSTININSNNNENKDSRTTDTSIDSHSGFSENQYANEVRLQIDNQHTASDSNENDISDAKLFLGAVELKPENDEDGRTTETIV